MLGKKKKERAWQCTLVGRGLSSMQEARDLKSRLRLAVYHEGKAGNLEVKVFPGYTVSSKPRLYVTMAQQKKRDRRNTQ